MKLKKISICLLAVLILALAAAVCSAETDYADEANWAYFGIGEDRAADVFLIAPTADIQDEWNMSPDDEATKATFLGTLNMERGIYEESARLYAPYYRQIALKTYDLEPEDREQYLAIAYEDVSAAFEYYLANCNDGRPIILAGFSQGADMCYRLMEEYFGDEELSDRLVAVYALGWALTEEMTRQYPQLKPATGETDTGVIISFECEDASVQDSLVLPTGTKMLSINPLNWKTDGTVADKEENLGACFTDYDGNILSEVPALCGAYIDTDTGVVRPTGIEKEDYPATIPGFPEGSYHLYDYQFYYRNLQKNVAVRLENWIKTH